MNRRGFLAFAAALLVAPDPDQLLWRPGARLISIPAPRALAPWYAEYVRMDYEVLSHWPERGPGNGVRVGDTLLVRRPTPWSPWEIVPRGGPRPTPQELVTIQSQAELDALHAFMRRGENEPRRRA